MGNENINNIGFEADITAVQALVPQALQDATPVLSAAIDVRTYPRCRILLVAQSHEVTGTTHTTAFTVTECATTDGSYTAAATSGTLTASAATDVIRWASIKRNAAKPFIKITVTGSHADVDVLCEAHVLFIQPIV
jgi:hypothetical protein